eukprot:GDKJ01055730.1.p1 GENE.GDKJ01055730.1~~GDKJ01055730.1.p1  ORF type:complete len:383 (-),score=63.05 GDKJ01055730.1:223-1371(-)
MTSKLLFTVGSILVVGDAILPRVKVVDVPSTPTNLPPATTTATTNSPQYSTQILTVTTTPIFGCPQGFNRVTDVLCESVSHAATTMACNSGLTMKNGKCQGTVTIAPDFLCPSGYTASISSQTCSKVTTRNASNICPLGYELSADKCVKLKITPSIPTCASGFNLSTASTCIDATGKFTQSSLVGCPSGSYLTANNTCASSFEIPASLGCTDGYSFVGGSSCSKTENVSIFAFCPAGYELKMNSICEQVLPPADPMFVCPSGGNYALEVVTLTNGVQSSRCTSVQQVYVNASCPTGFTLNTTALASFNFASGQAIPKACEQSKVEMTALQGALNVTQDAQGESLGAEYDKNNTVVIYQPYNAPPEVNFVYQPVVVKQKNLRL